MKSITILLAIFSLSFLIYQCGKQNKQYTIKELKNERMENEVYKEVIARQKSVNKNDTLASGQDLNPDLKGYSIDTLCFFLKSVYGPDDRKNLYEVDASLKSDAGKVAAMLKKDRLKDNGDGTFEIIPKGTLSTIEGVCPDENFSNEPVAAFCSGFAISDSLIATAGHCISEMDLGNVMIVFGFCMTTKYNANTKISASDVFEPVRIIKKNTANSEGLDFAIVQVNKRIPPERIVKYRMTGSVNKDQKIYVIGYPSGLPIKIAENASVIKNDFSNYFVTNLDTFEGNSGSPVFNFDDHIVEGILVGGNKDYEYIKTTNCAVSIRCPQTIDTCSGEYVSRTSQFWDVLKK